MQMYRASIIPLLKYRIIIIKKSIVFYACVSYVFSLSLELELPL